MIVDIHTHIFPDQIADRAVAKLRSISHLKNHTDGTAADLRRSMQEAGIRWSLVLPVATNPEKLVHMNDAALALNGVDGLLSFGAVHPDAPDWKQELDRIARGGLLGVKLHPAYQGVDLDDVRYLRILDRCGELGLTVLTHMGDDVGYPGVIRCTPEMGRSALRQVGPVQVIFAHMGGWQNWDRVVDTLGDTGALFDTAASLGASDWFDSPPQPWGAALLSSERFCGLVSALGADRILFGTDSPWCSQKQAVDWLMMKGLK